LPYGINYADAVHLYEFLLTEIQFIRLVIIISIIIINLSVYKCLPNLLSLGKE